MSKHEMTWFIVKMSGCAIVAIGMICERVLK